MSSGIASCNNHLAHADRVEVSLLLQLLGMEGWKQNINAIGMCLVRVRDTKL